MRPITYKKLNQDDSIKRSLDQMVHELSTTGRTISTNPRATRELSIQLRILKQKNHIYITKDPYSHVTIITVHPARKLEKVNDRTIKITGD